MLYEYTYTHIYIYIYTYLYIYREREICDSVRCSLPRPLIGIATNQAVPE